MALNTASLAFLRGYARDYQSLQAAATDAQELLTRRLEETHIPLYTVSARAKDRGSLRRKLLSRRYARPSQQVLDQLGIRVITYFEDHVDRVVRELRPALAIDESKSEDKRSSLGPREFGYRSVHLVGRLEGFPFGTNRRARLDRRWFEVQVRSLLEHGWAEIEHDVVYKSGIKFEEKVLREWGALAGALEIADAHFLTLRAKRQAIVAQHKQTFAEGRELTDSWDVARLLAFLELERPNGLGWLAAEQQGQPFPVHSEVDAVAALRDAGIRSPKRLRGVMSRQPFIEALERYSAAILETSEDISHLACLAIAVGVSSKAAFSTHLAEFASDSALASAVL